MLIYSLISTYIHPISYLVKYPLSGCICRYFCSNQKVSGIIQAGCLTTNLCRTGRLHLNWLVHVGSCTFWSNLKVWILEQELFSWSAPSQWCWDVCLKIFPSWKNKTSKKGLKVQNYHNMMSVCIHLTQLCNEHRIIRSDSLVWWTTFCIASYEWPY